MNPHRVSSLDLTAAPTEFGVTSRRSASWRLAWFIPGLLLACLGGCGQKPIIAPSVLVVPSEAVPHQIGHYSPEEQVLIAGPGEKGFVVFGPYADLTPGKYNATFLVSADGPTGPLGEVDVNAFTTAKPTNVVVSKEIQLGASQRISLQFTAASALKYEFRVASGGSGTIKVSQITVKAAE